MSALSIEVRTQLVAASIFETTKATGRRNASPAFGLTAGLVLVGMIILALLS
jgi:hypothetical protein